MLVHPPEMEVQVRGEHCKDRELETVSGCTFQLLLVGVCSGSGGSYLCNIVR
jgi:hypothetical protein